MGALPVHHTATEDTSWDGPAAEAAMPAKEATLSYCMTWFDSSGGKDMDDGSTGDKDGDGNVKANYKFPHHRTKGGPANLNACRNGLARLEGSSIPEGDKAGVKRHLQAHLDDASSKSEDSLSDRIVALLSRSRDLMNRQPKAGNQRWYNITNDASTDTSQISIYDAIGWFGVTAQDFARDLNSINSKNIDVHLNSEGGEVFDGIAILNALKSHPANVTTVVDSLAASIASVIAQAGDKRIMMPNSTMMIHEAKIGLFGSFDSQELDEMSALTCKLSDNIASIYAARADGKTDDFRDAMRAETWYSADEAVAAGLADAVGQTGGADPDDDSHGVDASWLRQVYAFRYVNRDSAPAPRTAQATFDPDSFRDAMRKAFAK